MIFTFEVTLGDGRKIVLQFLAASEDCAFDQLHDWLDNHDTPTTSE